MKRFLEINIQQRGDDTNLQTPEIGTSIHDAEHGGFNCSTIGDQFCKVNIFLPLGYRLVIITDQQYLAGKL